MVHRPDLADDQPMTTNDAPTTAPAPPAPPDPPEPPPSGGRALRRSRDQRIIAGVCGGLGRYTGLDPIIFRIVLAVLIPFGGVGAVIYLGAWLFLAADGEAASPIEALLGRGQSSTSATTTVILVVAGALLLGEAVSGRHLLVIGLAVLVVVALTRHQHRLPGARIAGAPRGGAPVGGADPRSPDPSPPAAAPVPPAYAPHGPYASFGPPVAGYVPPPVRVRTRRQRSHLGRLVLSLALLVLGVLAAADQIAGVRVLGAAYVAAPLAVIGAGLVLGAWYGRARSLIALGAVLCLVLGGFAAAYHWRAAGSSIGRRDWTPLGSDQIQPVYRLGVGNGTLDLRQVDFADTSASTTVHIGAGNLYVVVPANVDVTVHGMTGVGRVRLFDQTFSGGGHRTVTDLGADGAGGGTLQLYADTGIGDLEVSRD